MLLPEPNHKNFYHFDHISLLFSSFYRLTGRKIINYETLSVELAKKVYDAPFALVSHNTLEDPVFNYGNKTALRLFDMRWEDFTSLPSRKSAEPVNRKERERLLKEVSEKGFIDNYKGVRISSGGRRFMIKSAVVWNVFDENGKYHGQAATFSEWSFIK